MNRNRPIDRRRFLGHATRTAAGATGAAWLASSTGAQTNPSNAQARPSGANERIRLAFVGTNSQGRFNLNVFKTEADVEIAVVCDVNLRNAAAARRLAGSQPEIVQDYRKLLDRKDIDAFVVCTPDHWHAIITIQACQAGKDVYCEKPVSLCVAEGRRMVQAARKHNRIVQTGTQQRSGERYAQAREIIQAGKLGRISEVQTWMIHYRWPGTKRVPNQPPPDFVDWDLWLGPRPRVPYDRSRCSGYHRFYWDYAGGQMTDMGAHHMDTVQWLMDVQAPVSALAAGGKIMDQEPFDTPDTLHALWEYPGWTLEFTSREASGYNRERSMFAVLFHGSEATLFIDRGGFEIHPAKGGPPGTIVGTPRENNFMPDALSRSHIRNFLDCMRTRKLPNADIEIGHRATTVCHLGNIAYRIGRKIRWDGKREQILDDAEASRLLTRDYRAPYLLPEV